MTKDPAKGKGLNREQRRAERAKDAAFKRPKTKTKRDNDRAERVQQ